MGQADVTPRRLVWWYLCVVAALTALSGAVHGLIAPPTGLVRTFYSDSGFSGDPLFQDHTTEISLAFLDEDPTLPRRFFSVEWSGFWFLPRATTVELYAGGDDRVDVAVDGQRVLRRNIAVGMHTVGETLTLSAGAHEILVRYGQDGGGASLNIQYAVDGETPGALVPTQLFPGAQSARRSARAWRFVKDGCIVVNRAAAEFQQRTGQPHVRGRRVAQSFVCATLWRIICHPDAARSGRRCSPRPGWQSTTSTDRPL